MTITVMTITVMTITVMAITVMTITVMAITVMAITVMTITVMAIANHIIYIQVFVPSSPLLSYAILELKPSFSIVQYQH